MKVRYLYEPGKSEGQHHGSERRRRSAGPIWSVDVYKFKDRYIKDYQPTLYEGGPKPIFCFRRASIHSRSLFYYIFFLYFIIILFLLFDPISYLVLSTLIHSRDWVSLESNLPYATKVISSGERNYMKESFSNCLVDVFYIIYV